METGGYYLGTVISVRRLFVFVVERVGGGNHSGGYSQFASALKTVAPSQHRESLG